MDSLYDRLKALGVRVGAPTGHPRPRNPFPIHQVIPGEVGPTPYGDAYLVETWYPLGQPHGAIPLIPSLVPESVALWAGDPTLQDTPPESFVFLDTETTGLAGGTGTFAFLIGVGRFEGEGFRLVQLFLRDPGEEPALLAALEAYLASGTTLVTFNGKTFDWPLLRTRYITNGWEQPITPDSHLDLLHLARRLWRDRLASCALSNLEVEILDLERTEEDVPGWYIPQMYVDYLRTGDARPLKSVFYHNAMDILSMAALLHFVAGRLEDPLGQRVEHSVDLIAMAKLYEDLGQPHAAASLFEQGMALDLPDGIRWEANRRLSMIWKREGNWEKAVPLWEDASSNGQVYAFIELAKHYEHTVRDIHAAMEWTTAAIDLISDHQVSTPGLVYWIGDLEHRRARLTRKMQQNLP